MGIREEVLRIEIVEGLHRALDKNFERVRENARREWESRFGGIDPSDACVRVRISSSAQSRLSVIPAAGLLARGVRPQSAKLRPLLV